MKTFLSFGFEGLGYFLWLFAGAIIGSQPFTPFWFIVTTASAGCGVLSISLSQDLRS